MPEKDIAKLFKIIELDNSQSSMVGDLVDTRNDMAHASGKFEILNEESYDAKAVSYTHLDVYKRQVPGRGNPGLHQDALRDRAGWPDVHRHQELSP